MYIKEVERNSEINFNIFNLTQYIQNITISSWSTSHIASAQQPHVTNGFILVSTDLDH